MTIAEEIIVRLTHDLEAAGFGTEARFELLEPPVDDEISSGTVPDEVLALYTDDGGRHCWLFEDGGLEEQVAQVADDLQDDLAGMHGRVIWPPCPGHPHPLATRIDEGIAWWACPKTEQRYGRIGGLAAEGVAG